MSDRVTVSSAEWMGSICVIGVSGVLDARSYLTVRHAIVKAATDSPDAVVIVLDDLVAPAGTAWSVLTSASWLLRQWPGIPLVAVSGSKHQRADLIRQGVRRYVPVHSTIDDAVVSISEDGTDGAVRLRARHRRPRTGDAVARVQALVSATLEEWKRPECVAAARCVATLLVENVLRHTDSDVDLRVEAHAGLITIAVHDGNAMPAKLSTSAARSLSTVSGLALLGHLTRAWGNSPHSDGKTVWAVLGPEDYLAF